MAEHPWLGIDLDVYERHMTDASVSQIQRLREITEDQLVTHTPRTVGILGVAGGNGLDVIDPTAVDTVYGFDMIRATSTPVKPGIATRSATASIWSFRTSIGL